MKKVFVSLVAVLALAFATAQDMPATVVDIATSNEDFSILVQAVVTAELAETLSG